MKNLFMMLWGCVFAIVISGCASGDLNDTISIIELDVYRIAIDVEILDEYETYHWPWKILWPSHSKAELYLKIYDKKKPEISLLYPLNIEKEDSGTRKHSIITPFEYGNPTVLVAELLDYGYFDEEEEKLLVEAARTGVIVCDTAAAYQSDYYTAEAIFRNKDKTASLATSGAKVLVKNLNLHKIDSLGIYESTVTHKDGRLLYNTVTILNNDSKTKTHGYLKIYAVE